MRDERFSSVWFGYDPNDWNLADRRTNRIQAYGRARADMHANAHIKTHAVTNKRGKIHDYWQLSPSIKVFFIRSEGVFIREMRQGHIWVKASITAFISPLQQRKKGEEEKTERRPKGYFFCLITATHSHTREVPLGGIYRACSMINGCISGRCMQAA